MVVGSLPEEAQEAVVCVLARMIAAGVIDETDEEVSVMTFTSELSSKVTASRLGRTRTCMCVSRRLTQIREHTESLERQYELASRAQTLGWPPQQVMVVDQRSRAFGRRRNGPGGLQELGRRRRAGQGRIILGIEVSRLARNNADWYQLLDLCALTDTLIADGDGLYHPADFNDRLVLGLKGTMSEAELHLIHTRPSSGSYASPTATCWPHNHVSG